MVDTHYKEGLEPVAWADVKIGDEVFIDSYQDGKFPQANPLICGPFTVDRGNGCGRWLRNRKGHGFMHFSNDLLRKTNATAAPERDTPCD